MLMRNSMKELDWQRSNFDLLEKNLIEAVRSPRFSDDYLKAQLLQWHATRVLEYPWAMHYCPPTGKILDIGSNHQFSLALLAMGHEVCLHSLPIEVEVFRTIHGLCDESITLDNTFKKYEERATAMVCWLGNSSIAPESFDTIYIISVIEHIPDLSDDIHSLGSLLDATWKALKPGGRLCITADWFVQFAPEDGVEEMVFNYNLGKHFDRLGAKIITPLDEVPWAEGFDREKLYDPDLILIAWRHALCVYGVVVEKPSHN